MRVTFPYLLELIDREHNYLLTKLNFIIMKNQSINQSIILI
jgi:hypothetical protein